MSLREERHYAVTAEAVLCKQHERLCTILESLLQAGGWMRRCDLTDEEQEVLAHAERFLVAARKGPGSETRERRGEERTA